MHTLLKKRLPTVTKSLSCQQSNKSWCSVTSAAYFHTLGASRGRGFTLVTKSVWKAHYYGEQCESSLEYFTL